MTIAADLGGQASKVPILDAYIRPDILDERPMPPCKTHYLYEIKSDYIPASFLDAMAQASRYIKALNKANVCAIPGPSNAPGVRGVSKNGAFFWYSPAPGVILYHINMPIALRVPVRSVIPEEVRGLNVEWIRQVDVVRGWDPELCRAYGNVAIFSAEAYGVSTIITAGMSSTVAATAEAGIGTMLADGAVAALTTVSLPLTWVDWWIRNTLLYKGPA